MTYQVTLQYIVDLAAQDDSIFVTDAPTYYFIGIVVSDESYFLVNGQEVTSGGYGFEVNQSQLSQDYFVDPVTPITDVIGVSDLGYTETSILGIPLSESSTALTISTPSSVDVTQNAATTISGISIAESGATSGEMFLVELVTQSGDLSASSASGAEIDGAGTTTLSITGTLGQVNTALATVTDTETLSGSDTITVGAADSLDNIAIQHEISITVQPPPLSPITISGTVANQAATVTSSLSPFRTVVISDPNSAQTDSVTLTLSNPANGTLTNLADGSYNASGGVYTVSGTAEAVTAALEGLAFQPTAGQAPPGQTITTTFTLQVSDTGGESSTNTATSVIAIESGPYLSDWPITLFAEIGIGVHANQEGDVFGTTQVGGTQGDGSVFEIPYVDGSYASAPTTLSSFNGTDGSDPFFAGLLLDPAGDIFGTAQSGGASDDGTAFEIPYVDGAYSNTPVLLASFSAAVGYEPLGNLVSDSAGDLFGTTIKGGTNGDGTVFEIVKTANGYLSTPVVLMNFGAGLEADEPYSGLLVNAAGDIFGTTLYSGTDNEGTVFEIPKTVAGYATTPTILVNFNLTDGAVVNASLVADASGDLFGTTEFGGADDDGTVFEIVKTANGYSSTPTTLVSFDDSDGEFPFGGLVIDAAGDLFGATGYGGAYGFGTIFEIVKTPSGYANTPTVLVSLTNSGSTVSSLFDASLVQGAAGDLLGTGLGGNIDGVFALGDTGVRLPPALLDFYGTGTSDIVFENRTTGQASIWEMDGGSIATETTLATLASGLDIDAAADFTGDGTADLLTRSTGGSLGVDLMAVGSISGQTSLGSFAPSWVLLGTGDFTGNGVADLLWRNTNGETGIDLMSAGTIGSWVNLGSNGPVWSALGVGDFTGNGTDDILWRNDATGATGIDVMQNGTVSGWISLGQNALTWQVLGIGDFTGNGTDDLLWRDVATGATGIDLMQNGTVSGWSNLGINGLQWQVEEIGDFTGDGTSDILWRNVLTGQTGIDLMQNGTVSAWSSLGSVSANETVLGAADHRLAGTGADLTGSGIADIVWQNSVTGDTGIYIMLNGSESGWSDLGSFGSQWSIAGIDDYTGDGISDILWRNSATGETGIYLMQNGTESGWSNLGSAGSQWQVLGSGDFTGDGIDDILWRDSATGDTGIYLMQNGTQAGWSDLGAFGSQWQVLGVGDFTGNGVDDILWQNSLTGDTGISLMQNGTESGWSDLGSVGSQWQLLGVGDFTGEGVDDLLWRNTTSNDVLIDLMQNGTVSGTSNLGSIGSQWSVAEIGDFTGNGISDILWRDSTGDTGIYLMDGGAETATSSLGIVGTNWSVAKTSPGLSSA